MKAANVKKVICLLTELRIAFQMEDVGGEFGGNRTPEYLRLNPNGVFPALIDADTSVWESNTILRYIANRFGPTHFYPSAPAARPASECWLGWQPGPMNPCMTPPDVRSVRHSPADPKPEENRVTQEGTPTP